MAHVTVRRYEGIEDIDEVIRRVEEGFVPIMRDTPGFIGYHLIDAGGGVAMTASVFETAAGADESTRRAAAWVKENLGSLVPNAPQVTAGEERVTVEA